MIQEKCNKLRENIKRLESVAVAFSGGVDSTFLLKIAQEALREKVIAVTARSSTFPEREFNEAKRYAQSIGVKHIAMRSHGDISFVLFYVAIDKMHKHIWEISA
ncbi:NAD synthase [Anaerovirgula multivorans]|uniref:NAD synthase n=1 Tax=Anaerovirgula multivorans TaxID=312168 RepID=A0A239IYM6_9FIRM|nr:asparagine synthase-related protein [Anaerovirgula multivorans]SNS98492.1 NAD synthase [Anaerovirgula multivorans]